MVARDFFEVQISYEFFSMTVLKVARKSIGERVKRSFSYYALNDTGIGGAQKKDLKNRAAFKEHSLYLSLPVVVQLLHGITAVNEGGD